MSGVEKGYELPDEVAHNLFAPQRRRTGQAGHRPAAPVARRCAAIDAERPSWCRRRSASTSSNGSCATSAKEWRAYKTTVTPVRDSTATSGAERSPWNPSSSSPIHHHPSWPRRSTSPGTPGRPRRRPTSRNRARTGRRVGGRHRRGRPRPRRRLGVLPQRCAKATTPLGPLLLLVSGAQLADLELRDELFDDFCLAPFHPRELEARLRHLFWRKGGGTRPELVEYGPLALNLETYQASIEGRAARPHVHGVRAAEVPGPAPGQGVHTRDPASAGVGVRVLRRGPHGRRPRPAPPGQVRRGARKPDPDGTQRRATASVRAAGAADDGRKHWS